MIVNSSLKQNRLNARKALENFGDCTFKPESSAKWINIEKSWNGKLSVQIQHDSIKKVNPEMMKWWFENLAGKTNWNGIDFTGPEISFYHLWHHRDHIKISPLSNTEINRGFYINSYSQINEQFNDCNELIDNRMYTTELNEKEFTFNIKRFGLTFGKIKHLYSPSEGNLEFYAETIIGNDIPVLGFLLNWLVVPFFYSKRTAKHWVKHNIEETGQTEKILPILYEKYAK